MPGILTGPGLVSINASAEEATWANAVAKQTGLDPRVLIAWQRAEGHPGDTAFNYLNIQTQTAQAVGVRPSGTLAADTAAFGSVQDGIAATVREIQALGLTHESGKTPAQQIADIAASPWASSHYGGPGGPNLARDFAALFGAKALGSPARPGTQISSTGSAGTGVLGSGSLIGGAAHDVGSALSFPERAFNFLTSWRFAELLGGVLLLAIGLYLLGRQFGVAVPTPTPLKTAGGLADGTFQAPPGAGSDAHYARNRSVTGGGGARRERVSTAPTPVYAGRASGSRQLAADEPIPL